MKFPLLRKEKIKIKNIFELFDFNEKELITIIGSGGKTTTLFGLAHFLVQKGKRVITTTSTKIFYPTPQQSAHVYLDLSVDFYEQLKKALKYYPHITIGDQLVKDKRGKKIQGFSAEKIDNFFHMNLAPYILVEGDGSNGKSLKAYRENEPVVPSASTWVFVVLGIDILEKPLNEKTVHRFSLLQKFLNINQGDPITLEHLFLVLESPNMYLKNIPKGAKRVLLLNKADTILLKTAYQIFEKLVTRISSFDIICLTSMKEQKVYKYWKQI